MAGVGGIGKARRWGDPRREWGKVGIKDPEGEWGERETPGGLGATWGGAVSG